VTDLPHSRPVSRRRLLAGTLGAAAFGGAAGRRRPAAASDLAGIHPREEWGADLPPTGPIPPEDVRFLIIHHTVDPGNDYAPAEVPGLLRGIFEYHTSAEKGWPDVAYNFFVDRYGGTWEGRTGSLAGPVAGSATGGNQGFSQLCCFIGNFSREPPTSAAVTAMIGLLAALADRYAIVTDHGSTVTFASRGSNRWPVGSSVTARTIAAHRDMSLTECPGDACMPIVRDLLPAAVTARRGATGIQPPPTTASTSTTVAGTTTVADSAPETSTEPPPADRTDEATANQADSATQPQSTMSGAEIGGVAAASAAVLLTGVAIGVAARRRSPSGHEPGHHDGGEHQGEHHQGDPEPPVG
jgi:hypothetical protein